MDLRWSSDVAQANWIGPRLDPFGSHVVGSVIPNGYPGYARLLHPAGCVAKAGERAVQWREVAEWSGLALDRQAQFIDVAMPERLPRAPVPWTEPPFEGALPRADAVALIELLTHYTGAQQCWFCVWEGYPGITGSSHAFSSYLPETPQAQPDAVPGQLPESQLEQKNTGPGLPDSRVRLPGRDYLLYTGLLHDALALLESEQQTPNLFWPQDRSWCVATEIDLDSTFLAGPGALVEDALADTFLEALPVEPGDSIREHTPEWITRAVRPAVADLLERGRTTFTVDYGTVRAELRSSKLWKRAWLRTHCEGLGESFGQGAAVSKSPHEARHRDIESALTDAVRRFIAQ